MEVLCEQSRHQLTFLTAVSGGDIQGTERKTEQINTAGSVSPANWNLEQHSKNMNGVEIESKHKSNFDRSTWFLVGVKASARVLQCNILSAT